MAREGDVDPVSGQRAAFPIDDADESDATRYLLDVRAEAAQLVLARALSRKRAHADEAYPKKPLFRGEGPGVGAALDYDSQPQTSEVIAATEKLFSGTRALFPRKRGLETVYRAAKAEFEHLEPSHPSQCTSQATWKAFTMSHAPIPLDHVDTFRLYRYLSRWLAPRAHTEHVLWAWALLLRTPVVLSGEEVALVRDVARTLIPVSTPIASAFVYIVGTEFGQRDLVAPLG